MTQELNRYFCRVEHDTPMLNPHLAGLCDYFEQFDHQLIETTLSGDHLITLITAKYSVDKFDNIHKMIASIDATTHHTDEEGNYTTLFKDKEHERQGLMVTLTPVIGVCRLLLEQEDGEEVQL